MCVHWRPSRGVKVVMATRTLIKTPTKSSGHWCTGVAVYGEIDIKVAKFHVN